MGAPQRYVVGMAGISLGNGLLAVSYALDRTLLGPFTTVALVFASLAALAAAVTVLVTSPDDFDVEGSRAPTVAFAAGIAAVLAGLITVVVAFTAVG